MATADGIQELKKAVGEAQRDVDRSSARLEQLTGQLKERFSLTVEGADAALAKLNATIDEMEEEMQETIEQLREQLGSEGLL